jgi:hypothetical protein
VEASYRLADAIAKDSGGGSEAIRAFVSLGSQGRNPNNIERDLHRWIANLKSLHLQPYWIKLKLLIDPTSTEAEEVDFPVLAIHEVLYALYKSGEHNFRKAMLGDKSEDCILEFWESALMQPWGASHPACAKPQELHRTIPLVLHVDGAESYTNQEAIIYSTSSPFVKHISVYLTKFLAAVLMNGDVDTKQLWEEANETLAKFFGWTFKCCEDGIMPATGMYDEEFNPRTPRGKLAGEEIAGGFKFIYLGWLGDKKAKKESLYFTRCSPKKP